MIQALPANETLTTLGYKLVLLPNLTRQVPLILQLKPP